MTNIEWVKNKDGTKGKTWNPVTGCRKISAGCKHCYAERMARRLAGRYGYPEAPHHFDVTLHPDKLDEPLKRKKPTTYFVCSMGDLFHEDVPTPYIADVWNVMRQCPQHTFQVLTKRPHPMLSILSDWDVVLPNVWLGVTIENQDHMNRLDYLVNTPAAIRFVSHEPLLSAIDYEAHPIGPRDANYGKSVLTLGLINWVISGGESGPGARPMHPQWVRDIRDQCQAAHVPFFFKQWGAWAHIPSDTRYPLPQNLHWWPDRNLMGRVGTKRAGHLLDGREWREFPQKPNLKRLLKGASK